MNMIKLKEIIADKDLFDEEWYVSSYPDVKSSSLSPLDHYLKYGLLLDRNPSEKFNTRYYKNNNLDVASSDLHPLVHYCFHGAEEGRAPVEDGVIMQKNDDILTVNSGVDDHFLGDQLHIRQVVEESLDIEYLEEQIEGDVVDVVSYYILNSFKLNPNRDFDTDYYLSSYQDIKDAGVSPFYHYLVAGKEEGRRGNPPINIEQDIIFSSIKLQSEGSVSYKKNKASDLLPAAVIVEKIFGEISKCEQTAVFVAISHDCYLDNVGGVQTCLIQEQSSANNKHVAYLSLYPNQPFLRLSQIEAEYGVNLNGVYMGLVDGVALKELMMDLSVKLESYLTIHTLQGTNAKVLESVINSSSFKNIYFWVHDYFIMCEGFNLLRNNVEYCGGAPLGSLACEVCTYGSGRLHHIKQMDSILDKVDTIVTPSNAATEILLKYRPELKFKTVTHPHHNIVDSVTSLISLKKVKVAFVGYGTFHKGYFDFVEIVKKLEGNEQFEFLKFSNDRIKSGGIKNIRAAVTKDEPQAMVSALKKEQVDVVVMPSKWPETFNLVTYEALLAKVPVLVVGDTGNPSNVIRESGLGWVCRSVDDAVDQLIDILANGSLDIDEIKLSPSSLTIDLI
jgi:hypothetical protein